MRRFVLVFTITSVAFLAAGSVGAQEEGRYFPESGHTLDGRYVTYFDAHGGPTLLGFPITEMFLDPDSGLFVQYTENARLEYLPARDGGDPSVRQTPLGELLGGWQEPLPEPQFPLGTDPGCRHYPESGHNVCHAFLSFFENQGGAAIFGYPISEFTIKNGRIVQYFQGYRLDWYPQSRSGSLIRPAPLGRIHFELSDYDPTLLRPHLPDNMLEYRVLDLQPSASLWSPVLASNDSQKLFLVIRDQNLNPVQGAAVTLVATFEGQERTYVMPLTDRDGVSTFELAFEDVSVGSKVDLEYWVVFGENQVSTRDSFRVVR